VEPEDFQVEFHSGIPAYKQIVDQVVTAIGAGRLVEGDRIPTIRALAAALEVNPNTVAKAYRELELTGRIESRRGAGSFVQASDRESGPTAAEKQKKLTELFERYRAEAQGFQISEDEFRAFLKKGMSHG